MIRERVQKVFHKVFEDVTIEIFDEMNAGSLNEWDSLKHIGLIVEVEKEFGIRFRNSEVARLKNVGDLLRLVEKYNPGA